MQTPIPGQQYRIINEFTDYDGRRHPAGETWVFEQTNFVPYEDGLTLHVLIHGLLLIYRFQQRPEEQAALIAHFTDFVTPV